jgi:Uma2 family endonuclease
MATTPDRAPAGRIVLNVEDYYDLPDDNLRYEILDGELEMSPSPNVAHQTVSGNLLVVLLSYVRSNALGRVFAAPIDVILAYTTIVVPDLVFVSNERAPLITKRAIEGAPDLLVEILSPSSTRRDRHTKAALYARLGVTHYWILDPEARTLDEFERTDTGEYAVVAAHGADATVRTRCFPALTFEMSTLWS